MMVERRWEGGGGRGRKGGQNIPKMTSQNELFDLSYPKQF